MFQEKIEESGFPTTAVPTRSQQLPMYVLLEFPALATPSHYPVRCSRDEGMLHLNAYLVLWAGSVRYLPGPGEAAEQSS